MNNANSHFSSNLHQDEADRHINKKCESNNCGVEIFAACPFCSALLCFEHFYVDDECVNHNQYMYMAAKWPGGFNMEEYALEFPSLLEVNQRKSKQRMKNKEEGYTRRHECMNLVAPRPSLNRNKETTEVEDTCNEDYYYDSVVAANKTSGTTTEGDSQLVGRYVCINSEVQKPTKKEPQPDDSNKGNISTEDNRTNTFLQKTEAKERNSLKINKRKPQILDTVKVANKLDLGNIKHAESPKQNNTASAERVVHNKNHLFKTETPVKLCDNSKEKTIIKLIQTVISDKIGSKTTVQHIVENRKAIFSDIKEEICKKCGWSLTKENRKKKSLAKCWHYFNTFVNNIKRSMEIYVIEPQNELHDASNYEENNKVLTDGHNQPKDSEVCILDLTKRVGDVETPDLKVIGEEFDNLQTPIQTVPTKDIITYLPVCIPCSVNNVSNSLDSQEPVKFIITSKETWQTAIDKDTTLSDVRKEILSIHRQCGGYCTWTQKDVRYEKGDSTSLGNARSITLHECMIKECTNWIALKIDVTGDEVVLSIHEHRESCTSFYDRKEHEDYYGHGYDLMDEVLYNFRYWCPVFDPATVPDDNKNKLPSNNVPDSIDKNLSERCITNQSEADDFHTTDTNSDEHSNCSNDYSRSEGVLIGDKDLFKFEDENLKEKLRIWIRKEMISQLEIYCLLTFKLSRKSKNGSYVMYANCRTNKSNVVKVEGSGLSNGNTRQDDCNGNVQNYVKPCKSYKFDISCCDALQIKVFSRGPKDTYHEGRPKAYQLRGIERKELKSILKNVDAKTVQNQAIKTLDEQARLQFNYGSVRTLLTLRKARSEAFKDDDMHSDDLIDVIMRKKGEDVLPEDEKYVRKISANPLQVHLYTSQQVDLITNKDILVAYFDATGSIIRNVTLSEEKRILYYVMMVNINSGIAPVMELISESHDISTIQHFLYSFKNYCLAKNRKKWPLIKRVVCDWSWALIIGIVLAWNNNMDLLAYLNLCYEIAVNTKDPTNYSSVVTVHICCSHFMKMISDRLAKLNVVNKQVRRLILESMAAIVLCSSLCEVDTCYKALTFLLLSERKYNITLKSQEFLTALSIDDDMIEFETSNPEEFNVAIDETMKQQKLTKKCSPFNERYEDLVNTVKVDLGIINEQESDVSDTNEFYCPGFINYVQENLMPLLPLWSGIMINWHQTTDNLNGRLSNSNVENFFRDLKHRQLKSKTNLKLGRVIDVLHENVKVSLNNIRINIADYNKEKRKKKVKRENYMQTKRKKHDGKDINENKTSREGCSDLQLTSETVSAAEGIQKCIARQEEEENYILSEKLNEEEVDDPSIPYGYAKPLCSVEKKSNDLINDKLNDEEDIDDPTVEETWRKKRKSSMSYFDLTECKTAIKKFRQSINHNKRTDSTCIKQAQSEVSLTDTCKDNSNEEFKGVSTDCVQPKKFRVSLTIQYPHEMAMPNGLFKNPTYYTNNDCGEYAVSIYKNMTPKPTFPLFNHEYSSLKGNRELNQRALDACVMSVITSLDKAKCVKYINTEAAWSLLCLGRSLPTTAAPIWNYFKHLEKYDCLIIPYLVPDKTHYCLLIGDLKNSICIFYNPLPSHDDSVSVGFRRFEQFLVQLYKATDPTEVNIKNKWTFIEGKGPTQNDGTSCGVYVIRFVECWLKRDQRETNFDVKNYRMYLQMLCLEQSSSMSDNCLYCSKGETRSKLWVQCDTCKRWMHYLCMKDLDLTEAEVLSDNYICTCKVCLQYTSKFKKSPWT